jgi:thiol-disulfide isomerase/thioredoxin
MKNVFLLLILSTFINGFGQVNDSMEIELMRSSLLQFDNDASQNLLPDFKTKDLDGRSYTKKDLLNGKITFINLWFVACPPCIAEIPNLNRLYEIMKDKPGFQFFAITYDTDSIARDAIKKYEIRFPVLTVSVKEALSLTFGKGFPTNMIVDKEEKIRSVFWGGASSTGRGFELFWKMEIEKLLNGERPVKASKPISNSEIIFIDTLNKIKSIEALLNYFKGQSVYIDLWASWCFPCIKEFTFKKTVDSFFKKHQILQLYISIDNSNAEQIWRSLIYEHRLSGYHLITGVELYKDIKEKLFTNRQISIPRYIIVKNGKIVELDALKPSDDKELFEQLTKKLF